MGQPDIFLRQLTRNLQIVADLINFVIFKGKEFVRPEDLLLLPESQSFVDSDNQLRELRRDALIVWRYGDSIVALIGLESQTYIDKDMPFRGISYDGENYKEQLLKAPNGSRYPVTTFVLYYGEKPWTKNLTMKEQFKIPEVLNEYVAPFIDDRKIRIIDVRRISLEDAKKFRSVLSFIVSVYQMFDRQINDVNLPPISSREDRYLAAQFLEVFFKTKDTSWISFDKLEEGEYGMNDLVSSMVTFHRNEGIAIGLAQGREEGVAIGREEGRMEERKAMEQKLKNAAREMSRRGVSNDQIAIILGLDQATVDEWLDEKRI